MRAPKGSRALLSRGMRHSRAVLVLGFVLASPASLAGQLEPPSNGGMVELDRLLQRLGETRRLLMIGAHPDDEDTALLSLMARGYGARAAYLSLSRGEGGQNLIGAELGRALGLLRSRELLAARETDGATQFFTRAYDFGYTRSTEETDSLWLPDSILKDVVRVVRRFRPHVMVSVFSGTSRDGHGQHQAAGVAARAAFDAAGDPSRFPELSSEEGLAPWTPLKLYRSTRRDAAATTLSLPTGSLDPRLGQSYHQIAMASRSRHRSQDMGALQPIGPQETRVMLISDRTGAGSNGDASGEIFAGISNEASALSRFAAEARAGIDPSGLSRLTESLVGRLPSSSGEARLLLARAVAISAGIVTDVIVGDDELIRGQTVAVTVALFNAGPFEIVLDSAAVTAPDGWTVRAPASMDRTLQPGGMLSLEFEVTVAADAEPTQPYFFERPLNGSMYDWSATPPKLRGTPFQPPLLAGRMVVSVLGGQVVLSREATFRTRNQATGEVRREVRVVPRVDVALEPGALVWPVDGERERDFTVTLTYNGSEPYGGEIAIGVDGWPTPPAQRFAFERTGESGRFVFSLQRPVEVRDARVTIRAIATGDDRLTFDRGVSVVSYSHIRPTAWVRPARSDVRVATIGLPLVSRVGYVRGAADRVPEALMQVGVPVEVLDGEDLARGDLSVYDVIVVGSRAYEKDSALTTHNDRLLQYTRDGGLLVVQYQQYQFVRGGYAPYPLVIGRPHDRVTDETAPVTILRPEAPVFNTPNRIGPADWEGWPQERGLYFAQTWDEAYQPLLETHDAGRPPLRGGLLVARSGAGTYVYTGLSFFRALPAGNPGALRLFLNILGLRPAKVP